MAVLLCISICVTRPCTCLYAHLMCTCSLSLFAYLWVLFSSIKYVRVYVFTNTFVNVYIVIVNAKASTKEYFKMYKPV